MKVNRDPFHEMIFTHIEKKSGKKHANNLSKAPFLVGGTKLTLPGSQAKTIGFRFVRHGWNVAMVSIPKHAWMSQEMDVNGW